MSKRNHSRKPSRRKSAARTQSQPSLYRRRLRYEPLEDRRLLAVVTVTTLADTIDFNDGQTSLREAIFATNTVPGADTIDFAPSLTAGAPASLVLTQGQLTISDALTISGPSADLLTIKPGSSGTIFNISDGSAALIDVGLSGLALIGTSTSPFPTADHAITTAENLTVTDCVISDNKSSAGGAAIHSGLPSSLTIVGCTISNNTSLQDGGAIYKQSGSLAIENSKLDGNTSRFNGGAIWAGSADVIVTNSAINNNTAGLGGGGAIYALRGSLSVTASTISANSAGDGGGIYGLYVDPISLTDTIISANSGVGPDRGPGPGGIGGGVFCGSGSLVITRCTISGNSVKHNSVPLANGIGGGVYAEGITMVDSTVSGNMAGSGGAIWIQSGSSDISNCTISGNVGVDESGAVHNQLGMLTIRSSTITANTSPAAYPGAVVTRGDGAGKTQIYSSIVAGNVNGDVVFIKGANLFASLGYNLIGTGNAVSSFNQPGDQTGVLDPLLGPLADNGGPTQTHALLAGSPAINAGDLSAVAGSNGVPLYDQRGEPYGRVFNGRIDIGAFEYQQVSDLNLVVDTLSDETDGNYSHGNLSLREAILLANTYPSNDTIRFDPALTAGGPAAILLTHGDLKISSSVTIIGAGADLLTIDASGNDPTPSVNDGKGSRVFNIDDGKSFSNSDVTLVGLTLTGGDVSAGGAILSFENLNLVDSAVSGNCALVGGGVYLGRLPSRGGNLTLTRSVIQNNSASGRGGGIFANSSASALTILDSQFLENTAGGDGGGLYCSGTVTITRSVIQNNSAGDRGGGVYTNLPTYVLTIFDSQFLDNIAGRDGGGLYSNGFLGEVAVTDSVFSKNRAGGDGGGMLVTGGATIINSTSVRDNYAGRSGGGVAAWDSVIVSDSSIVGNSANGGGPSAGVQGGGGISAGSFVITNTTISGNSSKGLGGGIFGSGDITDCTITNNSAGSSGGGIQAGIGKLTVSHSAIRNNLAVGGGGISSSGALIVVDSAISGNAANGSPGSLYSRNGGGIWCNGKLSVAGTTISGNSSKYDGGGIWAGAKANVTITDSTISENLASVGAGFWLMSSATISLSTVARNNAQILGGGLFVQDGTLQLQNSIVSENRSSAEPDVTGLIGTTIAARYSLIGWNASSGLVEAPVGFPDANGNLIGGPLHGAIYAGLGNLSDNGGIILPDGSPIFTIPLGLGSPAINAGDPAAMAGVSGVPVHDQRGVQFIRVYGERLDIGAFESQPADRILGDFNRDGMVDSSDYVLYRKQLGQTVPAGTGADANGDGVVNDADYLVWKANFGVPHSELPQEVVASSAVVLGEEITVTPAEQPVMLPQPEPPHDLGPQSVMPKATSFWSGHQQSTVQKQGHVLLRPSSSSQIAADAHRLDIAIEAWNGFDRAARRSSIDVVDEWRGASDSARGSSEDATSLAASIDAAFTAI
jgi:CSLREA domain-containing protein